MFWQMVLLSEYETPDDIKREKVRLYWDFSEVSALQDDVDAVQKRTLEQYKEGVITLNQALVALGHDPVPDGDVRKGQSNGTQVQAPAAIIE